MSEIEVKQNIVEPVVSAEKLAEHMKKFQELKAQLMDKEDVAVIQGKPFIKRSGWRKIAHAFNISDEIIDQQRQEYNDYYTWKIVVKATALNGRSVIGVGACSSNEKIFAHRFAQREHDVYAIAHTRAKNRAISDLVGSGEVSAEEIEGFEHVDAEKSNDVVSATYGHSGGNNVPDFAYRFRFELKGVEYQLLHDSAAYGSFSVRILKPFKDKHGIRFEEEIKNDRVVAIKASRMEEKQYKEFMNYLGWVVKTLANCRPDEFSIITEELKNEL